MSQSVKLTSNDKILFKAAGLEEKDYQSYANTLGDRGLQQAYGLYQSKMNENPNADDSQKQSIAVGAYNFAAIDSDHNGDLSAQELAPHLKTDKGQFKLMTTAPYLDQNDAANIASASYKMLDTDGKDGLSFQELKDASYDKNKVGLLQYAMPYMNDEERNWALQNSAYSALDTDGKKGLSDKELKAAVSDKSGNGLMALDKAAPLLSDKERNGAANAMAGQGSLNGVDSLKDLLDKVTGGDGKLDAEDIAKLPKDKNGNLTPLSQALIRMLADKDKNGTVSDDEWGDLMPAASGDNKITPDRILNNDLRNTISDGINSDSIVDSTPTLPKDGQTYSDDKGYNPGNSASSGPEAFKNSVFGKEKGDQYVGKGEINGSKEKKKAITEAVDEFFEQNPDMTNIISREEAKAMLIAIGGLEAKFGTDDSGIDNKANKKGTDSECFGMFNMNKAALKACGVDNPESLGGTTGDISKPESIKAATKAALTRMKQLGSADRFIAEHRGGETGLKELDAGLTSDTWDVKGYMKGLKALTNAYGKDKNSLTDNTHYWTEIKYSGPPQK